ncbi:MAG: substrate-binding domain-containing protein [Eubacterium sp.]|nr:substrate-binding domain-containing protein [Eubacterium sp.]
MADTDLYETDKKVQNINAQRISKKKSGSIKKYPAVQFQLQSGNNNEIKEQLEQGSIDIGLLVEPVDISKYAYARRDNKDEWGILVHEDYELARLNSVHSLVKAKEGIAVCQRPGCYFDNLRFVPFEPKLEK